MPDNNEAATTEVEATENLDSQEHDDSTAESGSELEKWRAEAKKAFKQRDLEKKSKRELAGKLEDLESKLFQMQEAEVERQGDLQKKVEFKQQQLEQLQEKFNELQSRIAQQEQQARLDGFVGKVLGEAGLQDSHREAVVALIERAAAKYEGFDEAVESGNVSTALSALKELAPFMFERPKPAEPEPLPGRNNRLKLPTERPAAKKADYRRMGELMSQRRKAGNK